MSFGDLGGQKSPPNVRTNASFSSSSSALSSSSSSGASNAHYGYNSQMTQLSDQLKRYQVWHVPLMTNKQNFDDYTASVV